MSQSDRQKFITVRRSDDGKFSAPSRPAAVRPMSPPLPPPAPQPVQPQTKK